MALAVADPRPHPYVYNHRRLPEPLIGEVDPDVDGYRYRDTFEAVLVIDEYTIDRARYTRAIHALRAMEMRADDEDAVDTTIFRVLERYAFESWVRGLAFRLVDLTRAETDDNPWGNARWVRAGHDIVTNDHTFDDSDELYFSNGSFTFRHLEAMECVLNDVTVTRYDYERIDINRGAVQIISRIERGVARESFSIRVWGVDVSGVSAEPADACVRMLALRRLRACFLRGFLINGVLRRLLAIKEEAEIARGDHLPGGAAHDAVVGAMEGMFASAEPDEAAEPAPKRARAA